MMARVTISWWSSATPARASHRSRLHRALDGPRHDGSHGAIDRLIGAGWLSSVGDSNVFSTWTLWPLPALECDRLPFAQLLESNLTARGAMKEVLVPIARGD